MNIQIQHLSKKYRGRYALEDFSVTLENGVYGLLGTNGAGKTTFLNMFMGVISNDGGEIFVDGENIRRLGASFLSCIGYLPQTPLFYRDFTVEEFLRYMCVLKGLGCEEVWALNLDAPDVPEELVHHTISNLARMDDGIHMRILSAERPHPDAVPVTASLEEVFLYHCGEDAE